MKEIYSLWDLPNITAVYAVFERKQNNQYITAIRQTTHLKESFLSRLFSNFDELILAEPNSVINPKKIVEIKWWEINKFYYSDRRHAAALIAKELLNNKKLSSIDYKYLAESTKKYYNDPSFRSDMKAIFEGEPSGILKDINIEKDVNRIEEFREIVNKLINSPKSELLGIFNSDQKKRIFKYIWRIDNLKQSIDFAYYLAYDHPYDEIIFHNMESRNLFALALALSCLSEKIGESHYRQGTVSAFAVLLATEYEINFDAPRIYKEIYGADAPENAGHRAFSYSYSYAPFIREVKNPSIPYSEHFQTWPVLLQLKDASIQAKKALIYIILRIGKSTHYISLTKLPNYEMLISGIKYLKEKVLVYENPSAGELLGCLTYKELKKIAVDNGITTIPNNKRDIINTINSYADPNDVASLIKSKVDIEQPVRPLVDNPHSLKKFFIKEMDRIDLYKIWIENVRYPKIPDIQDTWDKSIHVPEPHDDLKAHCGNWYEKQYSMNAAELQQIKLIWDQNCDKILYNLVEKYKWDTPNYIVDTIVDYLPNEKLETFKQACKKKCKRDWYGVINTFGFHRIHELKINVREPVIRDCLGCGKKFLEASIYKGTAKRLGYKILFCHGCYQKALYGEYKGELKVSSEVMLTKLSSYVNKLGFIPTANSMKNIDLSWISEEDQGDIVKLLLDMPTYEQYVEKFGSWLNALNQANLIDDKSLRSTFGYRCIAIDGHECYSLSEKFIDDWLYNNAIEHEKEPNYPYHDVYNPSSQMRADWKTGDILIEFAGLLSKSEYVEKMKKKEQLASEFGIKLIVLETEDMEKLDEKLALLLDK